MLSDPRLRVRVLSQTSEPQKLIYAAMHQDYSCDFVCDEIHNLPNEKDCGGVIVNRLLAGDRGHYGCYSEDTEVLTIEGWKYWKDVTEEDKLLAVDIESKTAKFEQPTSLQKTEFQVWDKMYSVSSQFLDFLVTQDHRMVVSSRTKKGFTDWRFQAASEVYKKPVRYLLNTCLEETQREQPPLPDDVDALLAFKLAGFFFGDGIRTDSKQPVSIRFRLRRPRKIAYLYSLGLDIKQGGGAADRYTIFNEKLANWIHQYFTSENGKTIPQWILTLPVQHVAAFWDGLKNSDGTHITETSWCYDSCEKEAIDLIQATAHINGFSANLTLNNPNEGTQHKNHRPCWRLCISEHSTRRVETSQKGRSGAVIEELVDYTGFVYCATVSTGALLVRRNGKAVILGNCLEHPQISFNCGYFPHSVMQQARTHRISVSFDVQSYRYTGLQVIDVVDGKKDIESVFYLRPVGNYSDRTGKKYYYSPEQRESDLDWCMEAAKRYKADIEAGMSEEHARGKVPFDYRQHFVVSFNLRSLLHFLDLRHKKDAQLEIQKLCEMMFPHLEAWTPAIAAWYKANRLGKGKLAP
jgi:thymidylate synthase (FAD)